MPIMIGVHLSRGNEWYIEGRVEGSQINHRDQKKLIDKGRARVYTRVRGGYAHPTLIAYPPYDAVAPRCKKPRVWGFRSL